MTLWFRLLAVVLTALFRRGSSPLLAETWLTFRVWPSDLDLNVHMTNARYLEIFDLGRVDMMLRHGFAGTVLKRRWSPVIAGCSVRFRRALAPFERFTLRTRLVGWEGRWFYIEQIVENKRGVIASALVRGTFLENSRPLEAAQVMEIICGDSRSPALPAEVHAWAEADAALHAET